MKKAVVVVLLIIGLGAVAFASFSSRKKGETKMEKKEGKKECKRKCVFSL